MDTARALCTGKVVNFNQDRDELNGFELNSF